MIDPSKATFLAGEGDAYYRRNAGHPEEATLPHLELQARYIPPGAAVLEIGCSDGRNLRYLAARTGCRGHGIDPSGEAIAAGLAHPSAPTLVRGTADELPYAAASFDYVFFGFCLYLVDRALLPKIVYEADRVLVDRGFLGITDFDAKHPHQRTYKHHTGLASYKMDYASLFLAFPAYVLVEKSSYAAHGQGFARDPQERLTTQVLYKDLACDTAVLRE